MDLVIIADSTSSMVEAQKSLRDTFYQAYNLAILTGCFQRIGLILYTDYTNVPKYPVTSWSGWCTTYADLKTFVEKSVLHPGGDEPEACKTALSLLLELVSRKTIVFWYGDAAPHHVTNDTHPNYAREEKALGGAADSFDWIYLCQKAARLNCVVCPIINTDITAVTSFFLFLATLTGGVAHIVPQTCACEDITRETIRILLELLGAPKGSIENNATVAQRLGYKKGLPLIVAGRGENTLQGYLPTSVSRKSKRHTVPAAQVVVVESKTAEQAQQTISIQKLKTQFTEDERYAETVFRVFTEISASGAFVASLTYNTIFAGLWRAAVSRHADPRRDVILQQLVKTIPSMGAEQRQQVKNWLEASYDASEEITEAIARLPAEERYPALILPLSSAELIRPQYLTGLAKSCQRDDLKRVVKMLAEIQIAKEYSPSIATTRMLPLALPTQDLLPMLPHLLCKGLIFTRRSSAILAILAVLSENTFLRTPARDYLEQVRGKWYDPENSTNYSVPFVNLVMKAEAILTAKEITHIGIVRDLQGLTMNRKTDVSVQVTRPLTGTLLPDYKRVCSRCEREVSFTLMTVNNLCGHCCAGFVPAPKGEDQAEKDFVGHMFDCGMCFARYAVIAVEDLNIPPRCHYCRTHGRKGFAPLSTCVKCGVSYVDPTNGILPSEAQGSFVCAPCDKMGTQCGTPEQVDTTIEVLLEDVQNRAVIFSALGLQANPPTYNLLKNARKGGNSCDVFPMRHIFARATPSSATLRFHRRPIINTSQVLDLIRKWVHKHVAELGMCMLCCEELSKNALVTACGRRGCSVRCCVSCIETWYSYLRPGHVLPLANLTCPFCKRLPVPQVLFRSNRQACDLLRSRPANGYDPGWYYGWCLGCMRGKQMMEKICAGDGPPLTDTFRCEACNLLSNAASVNTRECPGCGVTCEKTQGCDHITCHCGRHWCWKCGLSMDVSEIYDHLPSCPGDEIYHAFSTNDAEADEEYYDDDDYY